MKLILLTIFFSVTLSAFAHAGKTYYVAKTGKDSHSCAQATSSATPKLTINGSSGGLRCVKAGDTLVIKDGTYAEVFNPGTIPSGTSSARVTLKAASSGSVIIHPKSGGQGGDVVFLGPSSRGTQQYITFDGLIFDGSKVPVQVVRLSGSTHHIRFLNGTLRNAPKSNCIGISDSSTQYIELVNMTIHNCGNSDQHHGVYIRGQHVLVEHSRIYDHRGHGVHMLRSGGQVHYNTVRNNEIYDNGSWGILLGSGQQNLAYNNMVRDNGSQENGGGIRIAYNDPVNNQVYNNTIDGNENYCVMINADSSKAVVRNNICWDNARNMVYDDGAGSVVSNTLTTDPQFISGTSSAQTITPTNLRIVGSN
jgi:parallel beta-helix repeat protein